MAARLNPFEEFIVLFNNLRESAKYSPERVSIFYSESDFIRGAVRHLDEFLSRTDFERRVFHGSRKQFRQAPAGFEGAWKEYDARWRFRTVSEALDPDPDWRPSNEEEEALAAICPPRVRVERVELEAPADQDEPYVPDPEYEDTFQPIWHDGGPALDLGIEQLERGGEYGYDKRSRNSCRIAYEAYDYLVKTIGLNVYEVFRRWRRVPVVFMPAHVSNHYGASDKGSLSYLLDDAVRAYVFGAPAAAIAMCRAAYETVRKEHYRRGELDDVLVHASQEYDFLSKDKIKFLVDSANRVMHNYSNTQRLTKEDDRIIVNFLATVKVLIQRAPRR